MTGQTNDAEVIDISPLTCPGCRRNVELEDSYCQSCGTSLLETKPSICGNCGHALGRESIFCPSCGTKTDSSLIGTPPPAPAAAPNEPTLREAAASEQTVGIPVTSASTSADLVPERRGRRKTFAWIGTLLLLLVAAAAAAWFFLLRPPDLTVYDSEIQNAAAIAEDVEASLQDMENPGDLPGFATTLESARDDLGEVDKRVQSLEDQTHRSVLLEVVDTEDALFAEMARLAVLSSASIEDSEFSSLPDLVGEFETAYATAQRLRAAAGTPSEIELSHRILERTLYDLAEYREEVIAERARISRANKERAEELAATQAFIGEFDGIVARYADSRTELSDWIEETNAGATWYEAYQTLDQQQARRSELREELAALEAPAEFADAKTELLGIMDTAIDAMGAASRGMAEYQYDWSYWDFRDTPGWQQFESATSDITTRFSATLSAYEATKESVLKKLSKKTPLPDLPD